MAKCKCGQSPSIEDWILKKCCNFRMFNLEQNKSILYIRESDSLYYKIDNEDNEIYFVEYKQPTMYIIQIISCKRIINIPVIDESLSMQEIEENCIKLINNLCFI